MWVIPPEAVHGNRVTEDECNRRGSSDTMWLLWFSYALDAVVALGIARCPLNRTFRRQWAVSLQAGYLTFRVEGAAPTVQVN